VRVGFGHVRGMSACPATPATSLHRGNDAMVESRMGAIAWAMRQRSVSHPRSSNRTCRFPASGSPTGFTVRHTARGTKVDVRGATPRVLHRRRWRRTGVCHAPSSCAVARGSRARAHTYRPPVKPAKAFSEVIHPAGGTRPPGDARSGPVACGRFGHPDRWSLSARPGWQSFSPALTCTFSSTRRDHL
jgi:hypothetical protein